MEAHDPLPMRHWWVNHAQTVRQELAGGYLWSPVTEASGARSRFYDNMRVAAPGDVVLSYADGRIGRIGTVVDFAISAPKPTEFGSIGAYWSDAGWLLPVHWFDEPLAVRPKTILGELAPMLPERHSPIRAASGDGNQKAYLAEVDRAVVELVVSAAQLHLSDFINRMSDRTSNEFATALDDIVEQGILHDSSLNDTVRDQLTRARRGQGLFRKRVLGVEPICRVTGIEKPSLLIASHIKPWRACGTAGERLDGFNGLMLAPHADFLFDRGLIGFEDDGRTLFSSQLKRADAEKLGLNKSERPVVSPFRAESRTYFQHHRAKVYIP